MRRPGEVSVPEAARILEVHETTVRDWARRMVAGEPVPSTAASLSHVRMDVVGRYYLLRTEVLALRGSNE